MFKHQMSPLWVNQPHHWPDQQRRAEAVAGLASDPIWLLQRNCGSAEVHVVKEVLLCRTGEKVHLTQLLGCCDQVANARMHLLPIKFTRTCSAHSPLLARIDFSGVSCKIKSHSNEPGLGQLTHGS